jgi:hypothetical protein
MFTIEVVIAIEKLPPTKVLLQADWTSVSQLTKSKKSEVNKLPPTRTV